MSAVAHEVAGTIIVKIVCDDKPGLVVAIAKILYEAGLNIINLREHVEGGDEPKFFSRVECTGHVQIGEIAAHVRESIRDTLNIEAQVVAHRKYKKNIALLATTEYHCLADIILRARHNDINATVRAVIANRQNTQDLCEALGVPFHYVPAETQAGDKLTREDHEQVVLQAIRPYEPEYIVMARYMRVLTSGFIDAYPNRILNIHHSFLPAFIGANPYRQAYERGVKIIGATAHFASEDLDEGPIITQEVVPVDHSYNVKRMRNIGRDVEKVTLAKALDLVCEDRVFVTGNKTIIL